MMIGRVQKISGFLMGLLLVLSVSNSARAELVIDITQGNIEPMPIAITDFYADNEATAKIGKQMADVIRADLERSGLFAPIDPRAYLQQPKDLQAVPVFANWRKIAAQALSTGLVQALGDGQINVQFRLWDVFAEQHLTGIQYTTPPSNWRWTAHLIADEIYKRLTGEDGYFSTRIVYVSESGPADRRVKRLAIMDQDGENHQFLTSGNELVLTPRYSPTQQVLTYLSYFNNKPRVYLYNLDTGQQEILGEFPGMTFAPRFSPSGNQVVMSMAQDGNSEIYLMDLRTRELKRLTNYAGIDTAPSFSPDGTQITFESDRGGRQQIYVMDADGSNVKRISFGSGNYGTPVWSPRGDLIAFTKLTGGQFSIGVMRTDGSQERILTEGFHNEGPTWAPNGRVLMFFRQIQGKNDGTSDKVRLWSVDLTGYNEREVITPGDGSDPAWSPPYNLNR
ncbi:Tol-Pal system beta propeller repeat protein TolB [Sneathiella litorea]|uniref:Tol-Pal system protein TolB n=1 Tax=Sneathiella litorea TaxID=2606216 RepID=A0A6L8WAW8_9PROT|nr:Tol-Pal system beta propeller repeat protein TolB [Sneathiella litorea]MZR32145.1 Tol-Pal system protein TolB [Sneathiella litorea]